MDGPAVETVGRAGGGYWRGWLRGQLRNIAPFITLLALVVFFSLASPSFLTVGNFSNILTQISITGIMAAGLTFVILCAEIDLSVASVANATGIIVAFFTLQDASVAIANVPLPGAAAILLGLVSCLLLGGINAFGVTKIGIPSFIMTLAMLQIGSGICAMLVRGQIAYAMPDLVVTLGSASLGPVPWIIIVAGIILALSHIVLTYTRFGRYVYMVGGNREAAEYSGVNTRVIVGSVMVISAVCSGIAGVLGVAHFGSAQQNEFDNYLLDSISAVVVGGTSLFGGQGGIPNTIVGLFVLGVLNNGLDHIDIDSFLKILIRGLILLAALIINVYAQRLRAEKAEGDRLPSPSFPRKRESRAVSSLAALDSRFRGNDGRKEFRSPAEKTMSFVADNKAYEAWLKTQCAVVRKDLAYKHERMRLDAFTFLRATFFRWAGTIESLCPALKGRARFAGGGRCASRELRHLARRRGAADLGRQ